MINFIKEKLANNTSIIFFFFSLSSVLYNEKWILSYISLQQIIFVTIALVIVYFVHKNNLTFKNSKIILIILTLLISSFFTSYKALIINIILMSQSFYIGRLISSKIFKINNYFTSFIFGYVFLGVIFNIPHLLPFLSINYFYLFFFVFLSLIIILQRKDFFFDLKFFKEQIDKCSFEILAIFIFYILIATPTTFWWDEMNMYLFVPLRSIIQDTTAVHYLIPNSLANNSLHTLSFTTYLGSIGKVTDYEIVYYYKYFQSFLFIILAFEIEKKLKLIINNQLILKFSLLSIFCSPLLFFQITGNMTDLSTMMLLVYCLQIVINKNIKKINLKIYDYLVFGAFISISLKSIPVVIILIIIDLVNNNFKFKKIFFSLTSIFFLVPGLIRNYIITGNPVFFMYNHIFKSEYFTVEKMDVYKKMWDFNWIYAANLLTNNPRSISLFNYGEPWFSFGFYFSVLYLICVLFFDQKKFYSNIYILLGIILFFTSIFLGFLELRWQLCSIILLTIGFYKVIDSLGSFNNKIYSKIYFFLIPLFFIQFSTSKIVGFKFSLSGNKIFSEQTKKFYGKDFADRIEFYQNLSIKLKKENFSKSDYIFAHYLQDKIFLPNYNLILLDWYDFYEIKDYNKIVESKKSNKEKILELKNYACYQKKIKYFLFSNEINSDNEVMYNLLELEMHSNKKTLFLYKVNCKG